MDQGSAHSSTRSWSLLSDGLEPRVASGAIGFGRGFSLPDENRLPMLGPQVARGFAKRRLPRVIGSPSEEVREDADHAIRVDRLIQEEDEPTSAPVAETVPVEEVVTAPEPDSEPVPEVEAMPVAEEEAVAIDNEIKEADEFQQPQAPTPVSEAPAPRPEEGDDRKTAINNQASVPAEPAEALTTDSTSMTSPSSHQLPGNGFSVWTQSPPPVHAIQLRSNDGGGAADTPPAGGGGDSGSGSGGSGDSGSHFETHPPAPSPKRSGGGGFMKWAAIFLFLCALAAFLSTDSKLKEAEEANEGLTSENDSLAKEKQQFHDSWVEEQGKTAKLTEEVSGLETSLADSKTKITELTAQKEGLSKTIDELRGSLAMAIEDHKNTEASLQKVIKGLETKNAELTSNLQQEQQALKTLDTRLAEVMAELEQAKNANQALVEENAGLKDKVSQLQSTLDKTVKDAEAKEAELRKQLEELKSANESLTKSVEDMKGKLEAKDEALAEEEKAGANAQSQIESLAEKLQQAVAARDNLDEEKQALTESLGKLRTQLQAAGQDASKVALQERLEKLETEGVRSTERIKELTETRDALLQRNQDLQSAVEALNGDLSKLAEKEETEESALTARIQELTKTNSELKKSLDDQRKQFNQLLRDANRGEAVTQPSAGSDPAVLKGALQDLKKTLGQTLERESDSKAQLSEMLVSHTDEMLKLNTRMAATENELDLAKKLLSELDALRDEVHHLREQGRTLESELAQRATHITTLNDDNQSWEKETARLRLLLETEKIAQNKLRVFVGDLQKRLDALEQPAAVANK